MNFRNVRELPAAKRWRFALNYYRLEAGRFENFVSYGLKSFAHEERREHRAIRTLDFKQT
jgi:hypothetical protein